MKVGFIGLGMMGKGMAANLQKAGHQLIVHDIRRAAAEPYLAAGATWADSPKAVGEQSEVVFTSLPVPADVEAVALGPNGLIEGMKPDTAFFDMSTNSVSVVRKINAAFAEKNIYMLDSPVSGGPSGAASGKMAIWVGGDEQQFNRLAGVLGAMGDQAAYIGPIGAGTIAKLVHNCTSAVMNVALAEVFTMGIKAGVDAARIVGGGAAGRHRPAAHLRPARQVPRRSIRPRRFCAAPACTRMCRWPSGSARKSACRCGSPTSRSKS
jgi:3-hydroxyisobutyrate dehydrogenase-like beta-hydroxyacid dehydrogenase